MLIEFLTIMFEPVCSVLGVLCNVVVIFMNLYITSVCECVSEIIMTRRDDVEGML